MHKCTESADGGTRQRLKPASAVMRDLEKHAIILKITPVSATAERFATSGEYNKPYFKVHWIGGFQRKAWLIYTDSIDQLYRCRYVQT